MEKIEGRWASQLYPGVFGSFELNLLTDMCTFFYEGTYCRGEENRFPVHIAFWEPQLIVRSKHLNFEQQFQFVLSEKNGDWEGTYTTIEPLDYGVMY